VHDLLDAVATPAPPFSEHDLDGLDLEVRRTGRDRRSSNHQQEETG
jgi:hypothetical protein